MMELRNKKIVHKNIYKKVPDEYLNISSGTFLNKNDYYMVKEVPFYSNEKDQ